MGVTRADAELSDAHAVLELFAGARPDTVVHLAASLPHDDDGVEVQERDTFRAGANVVSAAVQLGIHHLLVAGSIEELGERYGALPVDTPPQPETAYGKAKDDLRRFTARTIDGNPTVVDWFRPFTVYGPGQRGDMLVPYAFECAQDNVRGEFSSGEQIRDFLFIDDLVRWIVETMRTSVGRTSGDQLRVHHVGTAVGTPVKSVLKEISRHYPSADFVLGTRAPSVTGRLSQYASTACLPECTSIENGVAITADWWKSPQGNS